MNRMMKWPALVVLPLFLSAGLKAFVGSGMALFIRGITLENTGERSLKTAEEILADSKVIGAKTIPCSQTLFIKNSLKI